MVKQKYNQCIDSPINKGWRKLICRISSYLQLINNKKCDVCLIKHSHDLSIRVPNYYILVNNITPDLKIPANLNKNAQKQHEHFTTLASLSYFYFLTHKGKLK